MTDEICQQKHTMGNIASLKMKKKNLLCLGMERALKKFTEFLFICRDGQSVTGCLNENIGSNKINSTL